MGTPTLLLPPLAPFRVTGSDFHSNAAIFRKRGVNRGERPFEVPVDIAVERFQRRHVHGAYSIRQLAGGCEFGEIGKNR